jgi:RHS repeat-associated protein
VGYGYDLKGQLTSLTYPGGQRVSRGYDDAGRWTSPSDWLGRTTTFGYDPDGNLTTQAYPNATAVAFDYDPASRLMGIHHTKGGTTLASFDYTRDEVDLLTSTATVGIDHPREAYTYTALDQLASVNAGTYAYDAADNLTTLASGTSVAYDAANQATSVVDPTGATTLGYDLRGNRTRASRPGAATAYRYDQANRLAQAASFAPGLVAAGDNHNLAVRDGRVWAWGANHYGQLGNGQVLSSSSSPVQVANLTGARAVSGGAVHSLALRADNSVWVWGNNLYGQLGEAALGNSATPVHVRGVAATAVAAGGHHSLALGTDGSVAAWGNNLSGQLGNPAATGTSSAVVAVSGLSAVAAIAAGNQHSLALGGDGRVWAWGENAGGQLGTNSRTDASRPVPVAGVSDVVAIAAGDDHSLALGGEASVWAWGENASGQLGNRSTTDSSVPVGVAGLGPVATSVATYASNGDGLRAAKTVAGATTTFAWDLSQGVALVLREGSTSYVYGPAGVPVQRIDASGAVVYYHHDQLGSTRALSDAAGNVVATASYDAYGTPHTSTGSLSQPFGFAGEYTDAEAGFQYLRARYYDPATGQFLTRDPRVAQSGQPYAYANNSPHNFTDTTGEIAWLAVAAVAWGAFEVGSAVVDAVSTAKTIADPCASGWDKLISGGLFAAGAALPGGGYSTGAGP